MPKFRTVLLLAFLSASPAYALPNLAPYLPSGWSDKIVVSTVTGTNIDSNPLRATDALYVDWAVVNNGSIATAVRFYTYLYLDGSLLTSWYSDPPFDADSYSTVEDYPIGSLSAGTHTIRIVMDATGAIAESNDFDNEYTKTITVAGTGASNLTPYQPSGWSDKIVVSRTAGTNTDSSPLTVTDALYVDWAVINNGSTATDVRFYTELYVDDSLRETWYSDPPVDTGFYSYAEDYSIGSLPAGTHTIRIKTDSTGAIAESNETDNESTKTIVVTTGSQACTPGPSQLCLNSGRFRVQVNWRVPSQGSGAGTAVPLAGGDTGYFWFFNNANVELMVKVLDGRGVNGKFWVFYGALSDVEYTLTVTDTATGSVKSYFNAQGSMASVADTSAFASSLGSIASSDRAPLSLAELPIPEGTRSHKLSVSDPIAVRAARPLAVSLHPAHSTPVLTATPCVQGSANLCLGSGRFLVQVTWSVPSGGTSGVGTAVPLTSDSGYFWFFNSSNAELVVKVLDGRALNGNFWVFFGALSDVHYLVTITDTQTGFVRVYANPDGTLASYADTSAMTGSETRADAIARVPGTLSTVRALVDSLGSSSNGSTRALAAHVKASISALDQCLTTALNAGLAHCSGYDLTTGAPITVAVTAEAAQLAIGLLAARSSSHETAAAVPGPSRNAAGPGPCLIPDMVAAGLEQFCNFLDGTGYIRGFDDALADAELDSVLLCFTGFAPACVAAIGLDTVVTTGSVAEGLACDRFGIVPKSISVQPTPIRLKPGETAAFDLRLLKAAKKPAEGIDGVINRAIDAQVKLVPTVIRTVLAEIAKREFTAALADDNVEPEPSCEVSAPSSIATATLQPASGTGISLAGRSVSAALGAQPGAAATIVIVPKTGLDVSLVPGDVTVVASLSACGTGTIQITGRVTDSGTGQAINGASLLVVWNTTNLATVSGSDGAYTLCLTSSLLDQTPSVILQVSAPQFTGKAVPVDLTLGNQTVNVTLDRVSAAVIIVEGALHHLGDSDFQTPLNAGLQTLIAEGTSFSKVFTVSSSQLPPNFTNASLQITVNGAECGDPVTLNGNAVASLNNSVAGPQSVLVPFNISFLRSGANTLVISSVLCNGYDDFEFSNVSIKLTK